MTTNGVQNGNDIYSRNGLKAHHSALEVVIVGAGIGGLSAAIFLRQQGHKVTLLEQSRFANELGAAVVLAPNSSGLLRRMGIIAEEFGANQTLSLSAYNPDGSLHQKTDFRFIAKIFQHPWLLAHRVHLHNALKQMATSENGKGIPAELRTSSKVTEVDAIHGTVTLENGEQVHGDVIIGADGVHSKVRTSVPGGEIKPFGSGKSAFRFLISKEELLDDPVTAKFVEHDGEWTIYTGIDRRIVVYPCSNYEMFNFVCIYPSVEYRAGEDWDQQGHKSKLMEIYKDWDPALLAMLEKASVDSLKVWDLLDMDKLPTWVNGRLALLGDAAHPFLPHQGQGAAQAIEDAAALAVVLPLGTPAEEVPERLKLYEKARYDRAHKVQEFSRLAGPDYAQGGQHNMQKYMGYNFGHDEWDHSTLLFRKWEWNQKPHLHWRMPTSFGPMPEPRQKWNGSYWGGSKSTFTTASVKFKTSATLLRGLFPNESFSFRTPGTVAYASFSQTTLNDVEWLGGTGCKHFSLHVHGVEYTKRDGERIKGTFMPVLFDNSADSVVAGREELCLPTVYCSLNVYRRLTTYSLQAGWQGITFADIQLEDLKEVGPVAASATDELSRDGLPMDEPPMTRPPTNGPPRDGYRAVDPIAGDEGTLAYNCTSGTRQGATKDKPLADVEYAVLDSPTEHVETVETKVYKSAKASIKFEPRDWEALPTLHHIVSRLAEIPVFEILEAKVVEGTGLKDFAGMKRVE